MSGDGPVVVDLVRVGDMLEGFLAERGQGTRRAYTADIEDFARYLDQPTASAVAHLLQAGPVAGPQLVLEYAADMRRRGRAQKTVGRRLGTLRTLVHAAGRADLAGWSLEVPTEEEILAAVEQSATSAKYLFPRHPAEIHRLDVQHFAMREAIGANHVAPVTDPRRILDTGCGTGQWGFEICDQFPSATVVGIDLVPGKPERPARYRFVKGDLLQGLPFRSDQFDLVHQRFLVAGVPVLAWPALVGELVRTARPGGWVELVEARLTLDAAGPATLRVLQLAMTMAGALGLDTGRVVADSLDGHLQQAGLADVTSRDLVLPVGEWGGRVGALMATDIRSGYTRAIEVLVSRGRLTMEEGMELVQRSSQEFDQHRTTISCVIATGRKMGHG